MPFIIFVSLYNHTSSSSCLCFSSVVTFFQYSIPVTSSYSDLTQSLTNGLAVHHQTSHAPINYKSPHTVFCEIRRIFGPPEQLSTF